MSLYKRSNSLSDFPSKNYFKAIDFYLSSDTKERNSPNAKSHNEKESGAQSKFILTFIFRKAFIERRDSPRLTRK